MKKILAFLSLGLYLVAGDLESGVEAYKSQNFSLAKSKFELACQSGEKMGCENLAVMYVLGKGMSKDSASAIKFYEKGCELGSGGSCGAAGGMYKVGDGAQRDDAKALALLLRGCDLGNSNACSEAGGMYLEKQNRNDQKIALELFKKACRGGDEINLLGCQWEKDLTRTPYFRN